MNPQWTKFAAILMIVAMLSFSLWPLWEWINLNAASAEMERRAQAAHEAHPELKPAWNIAMHDGVLTEAEAKEIVDAADKADAEEAAARSADGEQDAAESGEPQTPAP